MPEIRLVAVAIGLMVLMVLLAFMDMKSQCKEEPEGSFVKLMNCKGK